MSEREEQQLISIGFKGVDASFTPRRLPSELRSAEDVGKKWRSLKGPVPLLFQPETLTKCKENLKDAIGKNKDKSLASFIYGISRSLEYKVKEDLYLAPEWKIKKGTTITGITVLTEPKESVEYEKPSEEDMRMFGRFLLSVELTQLHTIHTVKNSRREGEPHSRTVLTLLGSRIKR